MATNEVTIHEKKTQAISHFTGKRIRLFANHKNTLLPLSPPQRLKGFFSGGEDPLSNVSAGTELQATAESAGASARYHAQDGRHPGEAISCGLLAGVACVPCISKNGVQDFEVK